MHASLNKHIVLTGDLKSSRKLEDRSKIQEKLKNALKVVNKTFDEAISAEFVIVGGDGFQGMLSSLEYFFDIYYKLFENVGHQFYMGIGIGNVSTNLSENVGEMDGEVFYRSSKALSEAKKEGSWIVFKSGWVIDNIITSSLNLMVDVIWNWSKRQKEIILYYRKYGENREAVKLAVENFGVGERNIYKTLRTGKYHLLKSAENALKGILNQKWLKLNIEPKIVDKT
jgi:hypothetical protein